MPARATALILGLIVVAAGGYTGPAVAAGTILVENRSAAAVKIVGAGGGATVDAGAEGVEVHFDGGDRVGIDARVWWVDNPRQLCTLVVPWNRLLVVSGTAEIRCRSE